MVNKNWRVGTVALKTNVQSQRALSLGRTYSVGRTDNYPETRANSNRDPLWPGVRQDFVITYPDLHWWGEDPRGACCLSSTIECLINLKTQKEPTITGVNLNLRTNEVSGTATSWTGPGSIQEHINSI